ncbi:uncharacterized protein IAS62_001243 [Cryptococcus decagattii]|uniref:Uncharacterized protein n=1 Tax=Cryptococcus decagattii TaxID=1859122 RepID=A0ABZ2ARY6_9TREE
MASDGPIIYTSLIISTSQGLKIQSLNIPLLLSFPPALSHSLSVVSFVFLQTFSTILAWLLCRHSPEWKANCVHTKSYSTSIHVLYLRLIENSSVPSVRCTAQQGLPFQKEVAFGRGIAGLFPQKIKYSGQFPPSKQSPWL